MKRTLTCLCCAAVLLTAPVLTIEPLVVSAVETVKEAEIVLDSITYRIYADHAEVIGTSDDDLVRAIIPATIEGVPVTTIADKAFYLHRSLKSVELPEGLTKIGTTAFFFCDSLETLTLPSTLRELGIGAFSCTSLQSITLPEGITDLPTALFRYCDQLQEVSLPDSVTTLGQSLFDGCDALQEITLPDGITHLPTLAFQDCIALQEVHLPEGLIEIGTHAFSGCTALKAIELPASLSSIKSFAFYNCTSLETIDLPENLQFLSSESFSGTPCYEAAAAAPVDGIVYLGTAACDFVGTLPEDGSLTIPEGTTLLSNDLLKAADPVTLHLPASLQSIGDRGFYDCKSLQEVTLSEENPHLCLTDTMLFSEDLSVLLGALPYVTLPADLKLPDALKEIRSFSFYGHTELEEILLPEGLKSIGEQAFSGCTALQSVTLPDTLTEMEFRVFYGCTALTEVILPEGLTDLGNYAFSDCTALQRMVFPASLASIPMGCCQGCTQLSDLMIPHGVAEIQEGAFSGCPLTEVRLPESVTELGNAVFHKTHVSAVVLSDNITALHAELVETYYDWVDENGNLCGYVEEDYYGTFSWTPLESLTFSNKVKTIDNYVFKLVPISDVYFYGSQEDWDSIDIGAYGNDELEHATIHFSDGTEGSGDVNWDGTLSVADCVQLQKHLLGVDHVTNKLAADLNQDGVINGFDLAILKKALLQQKSP